MTLSYTLLAALAAVPLVYGQGVILSAQGTSGSPASLPLQIDLAAQDANIINTAEITANVVNECGRTLLGGNIDIGANTETQLANNTVTSVTQGSTVQVLISQGSTDGAGPYTCDMDQTSNSNGISGQTVLDVAETDGSDGTITLSVTMPSDMTCTGASTGNICTVRCRNNVTAGPFGGCFAVQQTDVTAKANTPTNIATEQTLAGVLAQVQVDQKDLPLALDAISSSGSTDAEQGVALVDNLLSTDSTAKATVALEAVSSTAAAATKAATTASTGTSTSTSSAASATSTKKSKNKGNNNNAATTNDNNNDNSNSKSNKNDNKRDVDAPVERKMRWGKRYVVPKPRPTNN